jgi:hypothetical protein
MVAAWRLAEMMASPIRDDILILPILVRQPVAARPMWLVAIGLVETLRAARAASVLEGRWILALMIWIVALGERGRTAEQSERDRCAHKIFHVDLLEFVRTWRTAATVACIAGIRILFSTGTYAHQLGTDRVRTPFCEGLHPNRQRLGCVGSESTQSDEFFRLSTAACPADQPFDDP